MKKQNSANPIISIIIMLAMIVMIIAGIVVLFPFIGKHENREVTARGRRYLQEQAEKDISVVDAELRRQSASSDTADMDVWEKLNYYDTYIFGDSRCETFLWCGLKTEHVFAEKSATIKIIEEYLDTVASARPGNIVLSYGMNDMGMYAYDPENYWEDGDAYVEAYDSYIKMIKEVSPDTNIYINSIIPVMDRALESQPRWAAVDEWNAALKKYCEENDVGYIDADFIAYDYGDYFDDDGVHFYNQMILDEWGEAILKAVEEKEYW